MVAVKSLLRRFGAKFEQVLFEDEHLMSGIVGALVLGVILVAVVALIGLIFFSGSSSACPDGYREIRELQYFVSANGVQIPVYEVTGCVP